MTEELEGQARLVLERALRAEGRLPRDRDKVWQGVLASVAVAGSAGVDGDALASEASAPAQSSAAASAAPNGLGTLGSSVWRMASVKWLSVLAVGASLTYSAVELSRSAAPAAPRVSTAVHAPAAAVRVAPSPPAVEQPQPPVAEGATPAAAVPRAERALRGQPRRRETVAVEEARASQPALTPAPSSTPIEQGAPAAPPPAPRPSLAQELAAIREAQQAMVAGDARRALSIVRATAGSSLMAERVALEVFALCELGEVEDASERARAFFALAPTSPLAPRVARSCARR